MPESSTKAAAWLMAMFIDHSNGAHHTATVRLQRRLLWFQLPRHWPEDFRDFGSDDVASGHEEVQISGDSVGD